MMATFWSMTRLCLVLFVKVQLTPKMNFTRSAHQGVASRSVTTLSGRNSFRPPNLRPTHPDGARFLNNKPAYDGHIPLNWFENAFLAVGSAVMSLVDPRRGGDLCTPFHWGNF